MAKARGKSETMVEMPIDPSRYRWMVANCDRVLASPNLSPSVRAEYTDRKEYFLRLLGER